MEKALVNRLKDLKEFQLYDFKESKKKKKKNKKIKIKDKDLYNINLGNFQITLYKMILTMNNMGNYPYLMDTMGSLLLVKDLEIDRGFKKLSSLNWTEPRDINSLTFRGRFATLFTYEMAKYSHEIVKRMYKGVGEEGKRYNSYNIILEEFITRFGYFLSTFLTSDYEYSDHFINLFEVLTFVEQREDDLIVKLKETKKLLAEHCGDSSFDDGILCNNIMKLAYVLATENMNVKKTPEYVADIRYKDPLITQQQIGQLGIAIMKRRKKSDTPLLYDCFQEADPLIISRFPFVDECRELVVGHRALELLKLFMGNQKISNYINKIQRNV